LTDRIIVNPGDNYWYAERGTQGPEADDWCRGQDNLREKIGGIVGRRAVCPHDDRPPAGVNKYYALLLPVSLFSTVGGTNFSLWMEIFYRKIATSLRDSIIN
jgi:hypothetical protein